jgi:hypothetical protein
MTVVDPVKLVIENYPEDRKNGWKPKTILSRKMQEQEKFRSQENYILNVKTSKKKLIISSSD